jgi:hypothetical protein
MKIQVGRTPWSARVPPDPFFASLFANKESRVKPPASRPGGRLRTRGSALL